MSEKILYRILKVLEEINDKLDSLLSGQVFLDEKTERIMKEYEKRDLANFIARVGLPARLPNECPKCYEKGRISKGQVIEMTEFKNSIAIKYRCPTCGYKWVSQIKKGKG